MIFQPCSGPGPQNTMCLTVSNLTNESVTATQVVTGVPPLAFSTPANSALSMLVPLDSTWDLVGDTSGEKYQTNVQPQSATATLLAENYTPAPAIQCDTKGKNKFNFKILFIAAIVLLLLIGFLGSVHVGKQDLLEAKRRCDSIGGVGKVCDLLAPASKSGSSLLMFGMVLAFLAGVAYMLFFTSIGATLTGEPKNSVSCQNCEARGTNWVYTEPSANDGVTGWKLLLRKLRCRLQQGGGACMCFSAQDRFTCETIAQSPYAPSGLSWQADIANEDVGSSFSAIPGDICACCTSKTGGECFDVRSANPLQTPCSHA